MPAPVNLRKQDASAAALAADVAGAIRVADGYVNQLPHGPASLVGRRVLELGPGYSLGTAVLLACHGARVSVADRYPVRWDPDYHPYFFHELLRELGRARADLDPGPIIRLLRRGDFHPDSVTWCQGGAEELDRMGLDGAFDLTLSNAVLEHVEDMPRSVANLARVTREGGFGIHQVDFRDHRDFERPLEFLTLDAEAFRAEFVARNGECGNRVRHGRLAALLADNGLEMLEFHPNIFARPEYLRDVRPRLHADYAALSDEELRVVSGCFVWRRAGSRARQDGAEQARLAAFLTANRLRWAQQERWSEALLLSCYLGRYRLRSGITRVLERVRARVGRSSS